MNLPKIYTEKHEWAVQIEKLFETMQEDVAMSHHLSDTYLKHILTIVEEVKNGETKRFIEMVEKSIRDKTTAEFVISQLKNN